MKSAETLESLLRMPRAFRILLALYRREPEAMSQRDLTEVSRHNRKQAQDLRQHMIDQGWITVKRLPGHGKAGKLEIRLTNLGRAIAVHLAAIDALGRGGRRGA